jgi:acyl-ACP thioesterase
MLDFTPAPSTSKQKEQQNWMTFTKRWCDIDHATHTNSNTQHIESMNYYVFANRSEDEEIYPLTIKEIAEEQLKD